MEYNSLYAQHARIFFVKPVTTGSAQLSMYSKWTSHRESLPNSWITIRNWWRICQFLANTQSHIAVTVKNLWVSGALQQRSTYCVLLQDNRLSLNTTTEVYCVLLRDHHLSLNTTTEVYCVLLRGNHLSSRVTRCSLGPVTHLPLYTEVGQIVTILRLR